MFGLQWKLETDTSCLEPLRHVIGKGNDKMAARALFAYKPLPTNDDACAMLSSIEVVKGQFPRQISHNLAVRNWVQILRIVREHKDETVNTSSNKSN